MSTLGNVLWFILGGALMGLGWWLVGLLAFFGRRSAKSNR